MTVMCVRGDTLSEVIAAIRNQLTDETTTLHIEFLTAMGVDVNVDSPLLPANNNVTELNIRLGLGSDQVNLGDSTLVNGTCLTNVRIMFGGSGRLIISPDLFIPTAETIEHIALHVCGSSYFHECLFQGLPWIRSLYLGISEHVTVCKDLLIHTGEFLEHICITSQNNASVPMSQLLSVHGLRNLTYWGKLAPCDDHQPWFQMLVANLPHLEKVFVDHHTHIGELPPGWKLTYGMNGSASITRLPNW